MKQAASKHIPHFTTEATADVRISPEDLHDGGWHHESECELTETEMPGVSREAACLLGDAVASLHQQAHPSAGPLTGCHEEPCRSLTLDQLRLTGGLP